MQEIDGDLNREQTVLYLTYDGLLEPLGRSQVLAYLKRLSNEFKIVVVSFEKQGDLSDYSSRRLVEDDCQKHSIAWYPMRYHKSPSTIATAWDVIRGIVLCVCLSARLRVNVVHARSYVPSLIALAVKKLTGARYIFDMRGFWVDERVDGGLWARDSQIFRVAKFFEDRFLRTADHIICLTRAAVRELNNFKASPHLGPISVIPTCADLDVFRPIESVRPAEELTIGYVGSAGTWYMFEETVYCFSLIREASSGAKLLIVNRGEEQYIRAALTRRGLPEDSFEILSTRPEEVPMYMARMHVGLFFIKPVFSKKASAPTKLAEFLGCGVPCFSNRGVGDMAEVLEEERVGVVVSEFDRAHLELGIRELFRLIKDPDLKQRCVDAAEKHYSVVAGAKEYARVYRSLLNPQIAAEPGRH